MVKEGDGMVVDNSGEVHYSDPKEVDWIKKMKAAGDKWDKIDKEESDNEGDN